MTLAIGERHRALWRRHCAENWTRYANRHGYDVICIEHPLDTSRRARERTPAWQKLLILDQAFAARYERIVAIDVDVLINPTAPPIVDHVPADRVGATDEFGCPTPETQRQVLAKLYRYWQMSGSGFIRNHTAREFYAVYDLPARFDVVARAGVMVLSPRHHRDLLLNVYRNYDFGHKGAGWNVEMRALSYELLNAGCVHWLDPRFNYVWLEYKALHFPFLLNRYDHPRAASCATAALHDVHFLHFSGETDEMRLPRIGTPKPGPGETRFVARRRPTRAHHRAADQRLLLNTPVVLFTYARPDATRRLVQAIRPLRPSHLLVVGDAPPEAAPGQLAAQVAEARATVEDLDWDCQVHADYSTRHQGAARRIQSGLEWAFGIVEEAIVLEDGVGPEPTFFAFCQELLACHRDDEQLMAITGVELSSDPDARPDRYRYTRYPLRWGWATWRRAWQLVDPAMADWPALRQSGWLEGLLADRHAATYWTRRFDQAHAGAGGWHPVWIFTCWRHRGLCAAPEVNLVAFDDGDALDPVNLTEPEAAESMFTNLPTRPAELPLTRPQHALADAEYDAFLEDVAFSGNLSRLPTRIREARRGPRS